MKNRCGLLITLLMLCFLSACGKGSKEENPESIKIGTNRAIGASAVYVAEEMGYFDDLNVKVEVLDFSDGTAIMEAMAAGELDMCVVGAMPVAVWNAKGLDVRILEGVNNGGHVILTRNDTGIQSVSDLKGKSLTVPSPGTVTDVLLKGFILPDAGIAEDSITAITGIAPADMANAMMLNQVDAIMTWEPFASVAEASYDNVSVVYDCASEWQEKYNSDYAYPVNVLAVNGAFIDNHFKLVQSVTNSVNKAIDYINTDASAYGTIASILDIDENIVANAMERSMVSNELDQEAVMQFMEKSKELGYIEKIPEKEKLFDQRIEEGIQREN